MFNCVYFLLLVLTNDHVEKVKMYLNPEAPPGGWSWDDLVKHHVVEYIDAAESESIMLGKCELCLCLCLCLCVCI